MNLRRVSFLTTITLSVFSFLLSGPTASAATKVIGTLRIKPGSRVLVNHRPAADNTEIHVGDLVETNGDPEIIVFPNGITVLIFANTKARIYEPRGNGVDIVVMQGGYRILRNFRIVPGEPFVFPPTGGLSGGPGSGGEFGEGEEGGGSESLPYLPGFNGNFSGTSNGGGGGSSAGSTVTRVIPGQGIGVFDALSGVFLRFL